MLAAQRLGELVHVAVEKIDELHHHAGAALRVGGGPGGLGGSGDFDSGGQLGCRRQRHLGLHFAGGGVEDVGKTARGAFDVLAADVMCELLHGSLPDRATRY